MIPIPYLSAGTLKAVGLGLCVASILAAGFYGGYRWQAGNVREAEQARDKASSERDQWRQNAASYKDAIAAQQAANAATIAAAQAQHAKANKAIADAKREKDRYERKLAEISASVEKDKTDPACKAELERPVCGAPWQ